MISFFFQKIETSDSQHWHFNECLGNWMMAIFVPFFIKLANAIRSSYFDIWLNQFHKDRAEQRLFKRLSEDTRIHRWFLLFITGIRPIYGSQMRHNKEIAGRFLTFPFIKVTIFVREGISFGIKFHTSGHLSSIRWYLWLLCLAYL